MSEAGRASKTAGGVLFAIGALIILVGSAVTALALNDQADNEQSGPLGIGEDPDRTDRNMGAIQAGALTLALGALIAIGGAIGVMVGIGQRSAQVRAAWRDSLGPAADTDTASGPTPVPRGVVIGASALVGLVIVVSLVWALGASPAASLAGAGHKDNVLGDRSIVASIPPTATVAGNSQTPFSTTNPFTAPAGTTRIDVQVDWTPGDVQAIQFSIEQQVDGAWRELTNQVLSPKDAFSVALTDPSTALRFRAFPGEDGFTQGQDYTVALVFYA